MLTILFVFVEISNIFGQLIVANSYDSATQTEIYNITSSSSSNQSIHCGAANSGTTTCIISCSLDRVCSRLSIDASSVEYLELNCLAPYACFGVNVTGPTVEADINCLSGDYSCSHTDFILTNTPNVNIVCGGDSQICREATIKAANADRVAINCVGNGACLLSQIYVNNVSTQAIISSDGRYSLQYTTIYASNANRLDIECNYLYSCDSLDIYPPSKGVAYAFKLYCIAIPSSCDNVDVIIPSSISQTTNYMELVCPMNALSTACDIQFQCEDLGTSTYQTYTAWSSELLQFICNDQDCCPWIDPQDMVANTTTNTILPNSITPTSDNGTHQYYNITNDGVSFKQISCTASEACYVSCTLSEVCQSATIYAGLTKYLQLDCLANKACDDLYITQGPTDRADINCITTEGAACYSADCILTNTAEVNIICSGNDTTINGDIANCPLIMLRAENAENVAIECKGNHDCWYANFHLNNVGGLATINTNGYYSLSYANIYASNAVALELNCNASNACVWLDVYPPHKSEYGYKMECSSAPYSCRNVELFVPSSLSVAANWMELICATTNDINYICDIGFVCQDLSSYPSTSMIWKDSASRYKCDNQDCCPWTYLPTNAPSNAPTETTDDVSRNYRINNFVYFVIIFSFFNF